MVSGEIYGRCGVGGRWMMAGWEGTGEYWRGGTGWMDGGWMVATGWMGEWWMDGR